MDDNTLALALHDDAPSSIGRAFDELAMRAWPHVARALGYTVRVGPDCADDGREVLRAVWGAVGATPPAELAWVGERYDRATTWIVAYRGAEPVGVFGLLDMRVASVSLDYDRRTVPAGLDLACTRELARLAIVPSHRRGRGVVMVALLREMLHWSKQNHIKTLFAGSTPRLFRVYARYNATARLVDTLPAPPESEALSRYFAPLRARGGPGVHFTFEVDGARPWDVFTRFLAGKLYRRRSG